MFVLRKRLATRLNLFQAASLGGIVLSGTLSFVSGGHTMKAYRTGGYQRATCLAQWQCKTPLRQIQRDGLEGLCLWVRQNSREIISELSRQRSLTQTKLTQLIQLN